MVHQSARVADRLVKSSVILILVSADLPGQVEDGADWATMRPGSDWHANAKLQTVGQSPMQTWRDVEAIDARVPPTVELEGGKEVVRPWPDGGEIVGQRFIAFTDLRLLHYAEFLRDDHPRLKSGFATRVHRDLCTNANAELEWVAAANELI